MLARPAGPATPTVPTHRTAAPHRSETQPTNKPPPRKHTTTYDSCRRSSQDRRRSTLQRSASVRDHLTPIRTEGKRHSGASPLHSRASRHRRSNPQPNNNHNNYNSLNRRTAFRTTPPRYGLQRAANTAFVAAPHGQPCQPARTATSGPHPRAPPTVAPPGRPAPPASTAQPRPVTQPARPPARPRPAATRQSMHCRGVTRGTAPPHACMSLSTACPQRTIPYAKTRRTCRGQARRRTGDQVHCSARPRTSRVVSARQSSRRPYQTRRAAARLHPAAATRPPARTPTPGCPTLPRPTPPQTPRDPPTVRVHDKQRRPRHSRRRREARPSPTVPPRARTFVRSLTAAAADPS